MKKEISSEPKKHLGTVLYFAQWDSIRPEDVAVRKFLSTRSRFLVDIFWASSCIPSHTLRLNLFNASRSCNIKTRECSERQSGKLTVSSHSDWLPSRMQSSKNISSCWRSIGVYVDNVHAHLDRLGVRKWSPTSCPHLIQRFHVPS